MGLEEIHQRGVELLVLFVVRRVRRALELHEAAARQQLRRRLPHRERHDLVLVAPGEQHRDLRCGELFPYHVIVQLLRDVLAECREGFLRTWRVVDAEFGFHHLRRDERLIEDDSRELARDAFPCLVVGAALDAATRLGADRYQAHAAAQRDAFDEVRMLDRAGSDDMAAERGTDDKSLLLQITDKTEKQFLVSWNGTLHPRPLRGEAVAWQVEGIG